VGAKQTLAKSVDLLLELMENQTLQQQNNWREEGEKRLGSAGGTNRMAAAIIQAFKR
jgi:hypothetical protein